MGDRFFFSADAGRPAGLQFICASVFDILKKLVDS
jgi:hypothetical protein